jgi:GNAT superfamily N-acetyltransferase
VQLVDLGPPHLEQAGRLAAVAYADERRAVPALPPARIPDLIGFAANDMGVAALDGDMLIGFLGCLPPWEGAFGDVRGVFSPLHGHGAIPDGRADIYDRLYQAASERWVATGILSHAIALYEHDAEARRGFLDNGFGERTVDAIRDVRPIDASTPRGITIREVGSEDAGIIAPLSDGLIAHLRQPPMFMPVRSVNPVDIARSMVEGRQRYVAAFDGHRAVAYLRWEVSGETFVSEHPSVMNITGAYALPEARGGSVAPALLAWLIDRLREDGYDRCGVDYEIFNPTGRRFWRHHFAPYSVGVVRRIDERITSSD